MLYKPSSYKRVFSIGCYFGFVGVYVGFADGVSWRMALTKGSFSRATTTEHLFVCFSSEFPVQVMYWSV